MAIKNALKYLSQRGITLTPAKEMHNVSFSCEELIKEVKEDIAEFSKNEPVRVYFETTEGALTFTDYMLINHDELDKDINFFETTLEVALITFELQNSVLDIDVDYDAN